MLFFVFLFFFHLIMQCLYLSGVLSLGSSRTSICALVCWAEPLREGILLFPSQSFIWSSLVRVFFLTSCQEDLSAQEALSQFSSYVAVPSCRPVLLVSKAHPCQRGWPASDGEGCEHPGRRGMPVSWALWITRMTGSYARWCRCISRGDALSVCLAH